MTLAETVLNKKILTKTEKTEIAQALIRLETAEKTLSALGVNTEIKSTAPMGRYLTADERDFIIKLSGAQRMLLSGLDGHKKSKRPNDLYLMLLNASFNLMAEAMKFRFSYLDKDSIDKILRDSHRYKTVVKPTDEAIKEQKEFALIAETTVIETNDLLDLTCWMISTGCQHCTNNSDEIKQCDLRKLFMKYEIAALYEDTGEHECAYQYGPEWKDGTAVSEAYLEALALGEAG